MCSAVFAEHNSIDNFLKKFDLGSLYPFIVKGTEEISSDCKHVDPVFICYKTAKINPKLVITHQLNTESLMIRHMLCRELVKNFKGQLEDQNAALEAVTDQRFFAEIEHLTVPYEDLIISLSARRISEDQAAEFRKKMEDRAFKQEYSRILLRYAKTDYENKRYSEALNKFKEIHKLNFPCFKSYYLTSLCFYELGMTNDALIIARVIFENYKSVMSTEEMEMLGDLLFKLDDMASAEVMYKKAIEKFNSENNNLLIFTNYGSM
jgi:tetratricopeptide (TPR) repeat protein